jgi:peptide/nickel transport system permease protein
MIRRLRANLLDELRKQYVVTARAKGLHPRRALLKYPLRIALNPFISDIGNLLPQVISGAIIVSIVLSLPTTGPILLRALRAQDMYLAGSFLMLLALLTVIGVFLSDLALAALDPRIRQGAGQSR